VKISKRLASLPPYLFAEIDKLKEKLTREGIDIIDASIGDPDLPPPQEIIEYLKNKLDDHHIHRYPPYGGIPKLKEAIANWYEERFNVKVNPAEEILVLIGAKEGIAHLPLAIVDPQDVVLVPTPAYPVYYSGSLLACASPYTIILKESKNFVPDVWSIPKEIARQSKIMFLNYPNNPTTAIMPKEVLEEITSWAKANEILLIYDNTYSEIYYDVSPISALEVPNFKEIGIEVHSFSKTFNMTGWRVGFAVGNREVIEALGKVKQNIDSSVFIPIQEAVAFALSHFKKYGSNIRKVYYERCKQLIKALKDTGISFITPKATFYLWIKTPAGLSSKDFTLYLLKELGICIAEGEGFGKGGEGFCRISLTVPDLQLEELCRRISKAKI